MGDINLDTTVSTPVTIKTRNDAGDVEEHHFAVTPLTKPRLDAVNRVGKQMRDLVAKAEKGKATDADQAAAAATLAAVLDERVHSTNGPVTITQLWVDGRIGFEHLRVLMTRINEETLSPPV